MCGMFFLCKGALCSAWCMMVLALEPRHYIFGTKKLIDTNCCLVQLRVDSDTELVLFSLLMPGYLQQSWPVAGGFSVLVANPGSLYQVLTEFGTHYV